MSDKHEKMLERVRALLAKAAATDFPEEADSFRAKADELMTKYAIELWQIEKLQSAEQRTQPEIRQVNIAWWWNHRIDYEVRSAMWQVFHAVARHARCMIVIGHSDYRNETVPVVGMPADITYLDMLFTHLLMQMLDAMDPHPRDGDTLVDALVRMKEAGLKWEECHRRLRKAELVPDEPWSKRVASKMDFAGKYTRYCHEHGKSRTYTTPSVYRRSFTEGFYMELRTRLHNQAEEQGQNVGSMAIALRDIRDLVREAMYLGFPELRPHPDDCDCDQCHRCDDDKCQRPNCVESRKKRKPVRYSQVTVDYDVMRRGREAGAKVQIISDSGQLKKQRELD